MSNHTYNQDRYNTGLFGNSRTKALSDTVTATDASTKSVSLVKTDSVTPSDSIAKSMSIVKTDSMTLSDSITKLIGLLKTESQAITDSLTKQIYLVKSDTVAPTDLKAVNYAKQLADTILDSEQIISVAHLLFDTVRLEDWISLVLTKPGVWTEDSSDAGSWTEKPDPSSTTWTEQTPPSDNPWSH